MRTTACFLLLTTLLLTACGGGAANQKGPAEATLIDLAPNDTAASVHVDLGRLRKSSLYGRVTKLFTRAEESKPATAKFLAATDEALIAFPAVRDRAALLLRGRFTAADLEAAIKEQSNNVSAYSPPTKEDPHGHYLFNGAYAAFVQKNVVASAIEWPAAIETASHPDGATPLKGIINPEDFMGHVVDFAVDMNALAPLMGDVPDIAGIRPQDAASVRGSVDLTDDLSADIVVTMKSEDAAKQLVILVSEAKARAGREMVVQMLGLGPVISSITVKQGGPAVHLTATVPQKVLTDLLDRFSSLLENLFGKMQEQIQEGTQSGGASDL